MLGLRARMATIAWIVKRLINRALLTTAMPVAVINRPIDSRYSRGMVLLALRIVL